MFLAQIITQRGQHSVSDPGTLDAGTEMERLPTFVDLMVFARDRGVQQILYPPFVRRLIRHLGSVNSVMALILAKFRY